MSLLSMSFQDGLATFIALAAAAITVYPHTIWMKPLGL